MHILSYRSIAFETLIQIVSVESEIFDFLSKKIFKAPINLKK